ncbi:MAG: hypothetical protein ACREX0_04070 [Noviherbaspirillum sp.]
MIGVLRRRRRNKRERERCAARQRKASRKSSAGKSVHESRLQQSEARLYKTIARSPVAVPEGALEEWTGWKMFLSLSADKSLPRIDESQF